MVEDNAYGFLGVFLAAAVLFAITPLALAWLWSKTVAPKKPGPQKNASYECGLESRGPARIQFRSQYYLYALIFLVFDVEAIFLLPLAVSFLELPIGAVLAVLVFVLLLVEGLVWAWLKGLLAWE